MEKKEIAERALKTFAETFISVLLTGAAALRLTDVSLTALQKALAPVVISALAAALSAGVNCLL